MITDSQITTSSDGTYKFWVDDGDYGFSQRFRLVLAGGNPFVTRTIDDVVIFPGITQDSTDTLTNKDIDADNNTLSNLEIGAEVKATVVALLNMAGFDISNIGVLFLKEQATAEANVAGSGQLWVDLATPNVLYFADDTGADFRLSFSTSAQLAAMLSDETGSGALVFGTSPTIVTPTIASFVNAAHTHFDAANGGTLSNPAFSVHRNGVDSTYNFPSGQHTKVRFTTESFDTNNDFNIDADDSGGATESRFTPTVAGKYLITASVLSAGGLADTTHWTIEIYKNGSVVKLVKNRSASANDLSTSVTGIFLANGTTDYFEIFIWHDSGSPEEVGGETHQTWFQGFKITE